MLIQTTIQLTNDAVNRLGKGERWFSVRDVVGRHPNQVAVATLNDGKRRVVGSAFVSPRSRYYLRVFSLGASAVDINFWRKRIMTANRRRQALCSYTNAYRIVHAEADDCPSIVIDRYNDILAIQITSKAVEICLNDIVSVLTEEFAPVAIVAKNDSRLRELEGLNTNDKLILGSKHLTAIKEGRFTFEVDVLKGQKTGAYLDYRGFRRAACEFVKGRALDAFCYQGWFACHIAGEADRVIAVDASGDAIVAAKKNAALNKIGNVDFLKADVFEYLKSSDTKFDFIHLDPPSFSKGGGRLADAMRGYKRLIKSASRLLAANGMLMVSSCSHAVGEGILEKCVLNTFAELNLPVTVVWRGIQDIDHPVLKGFAPSLYLKAICVKVG